jgi:putative aldouronate transport system substrate-binding protein
VIVEILRREESEMGRVTRTGFGGPVLTRRTFLAASAAAGVGLTLADLVAACGGPTATTGAGSNTLGQLAGVLPDYVPVSYVKPDFPAVVGPANVPSAPAYLKWPTKTVRAISTPPASGSATAMTPAWWAIPPSPNAYYDAVNKRLGAAVNFQIVNGNDYGTKVAAMLAGKQLPDMYVIPIWNFPPGMLEAVTSLFADLTDHIKGSNVRKYPFLANLPTGSWQYGAFNNRLYGIPFPNGLYGVAPFYRKDIFDKLGVGPPKTADELYKLAKTVTDPKANRWAAADIFIEVQRIFGVPEDFRVESNGKLTYMIETPEYEAAVAFMTRLFHDGLVHPSVVGGDNSQVKTLFESGRLLMTTDGLGAWHEALQRNRPSNPAFNMQAWPLFSHDGKATPFQSLGTPTGIMMFLNKNLSSDRIHELLAIANWCAATIGTEEYTLLQYGVEGVHWTPGANGVPKPTDQGTREVTYTYGFLAGKPDMISEPQYPDYVRDNYHWQADAVKYAVKSPLYGMNIQVPADISAAKSQGPNKSNGTAFDNKVTDIVHGRAPVSDLKGAVQSWLQTGGSQYKGFYESILAKK